MFDDITKRFANVRALSSGGQKIVYLIDHPENGTVVLKVGGYRSPAGLERIQREVDVLRQIDSKYFPRNLEFKVVDSSRYYMIEEYVEASTLDNEFAAYSEPGAMLRFIISLVDGLTELWSRKVVHRDIKPANILVAADGPKIIDLGIARLLEKNSLTNSGAPFGPCTPEYASPEQLSNRKRDIDHRSDQFSLGIVWAQLALKGQHPFDTAVMERGDGGSIPENILANKWARSETLSQLKPKAATVLERLLAAEPYQRFRRYQDLQANLIAAKMEQN